MKKLKGRIIFNCFKGIFEFFSSYLAPPPYKFVVEGEVMGSRPTGCNKKEKEKEKWVSVKVYCCHADD